MKKNNSILGVLVVLLSIAVLGLTGFIIYDKALNKDDNSDKAVDKHIKLYEDLDYVYDAKYSASSKYTEYKRAALFGHETDEVKTIDRYGIPVTYNMITQHLSDLKVPYVNINTDDANVVNKKLENMYYEYVKTFDECAIDAGNSCSQILTYRFYSYNNTLSIVVISGRQSTGVWILNYDTFTFDLETGKALDYNQTLSKLSLSKDTVLAKVKNLLADKMNELFQDIAGNLSDACFGANKNCYELAYRKYEESINNNSIDFFVNNSGNLSLLLIPYYDGVQNGDIAQYLIEVK